MSRLVEAFTSAFPDLYPEEDDNDADGLTRQYNPNGERRPVSASGDVAARAGTPPQVQQPTQTDGAPPGDSQGSRTDETYVPRINALVQEFEVTRASAHDLRAYLNKAQQQAKEDEALALARADEEFTPAWRQTGLPMKPSHLELDASKMSSAQLVNPKAIMGQYLQLKSKEQLHPPHTYEYNDTSIQPNFLKQTQNLATRKSRVLTASRQQRVQDTRLRERTWPHLSEDEVAKRIAESEARRREQDLRMPPSQYDLEKKIIASMHHKLNFLRNPRYQLPPAVKMLQAQFQPGPVWGSARPAAPTSPKGESGGSPDRMAITCKPPIKSNMTANPDVVFVVEPSEVLFEGYEVGAVYSKVVRVRNVTHVIRTLRIFPPASQYFHVSMPRLPVHSGSIAPGMAAEVTIRFTPDSLADYEDEFAIDTAASRFAVPLRAWRPPPRLTLAQELHIGEVLCGNRKVAQFGFANKGGHGRVRVIPADFWPSAYQHAPRDKATVGSFQIWPLFYDLAPGDEVVLNVAFEPTDMGAHAGQLVLVCDNCQLKELTVRGVASDVDVQLRSIDGVPFAAHAQPMPSQPATPIAVSLSGNPPAPPLAAPVSMSGSTKARRSAANLEPLILPTAPISPPVTYTPDLLDAPLWFGEVVPGSTFTRRFVVSNTTALPFPFTWTWSSQAHLRAARSTATATTMTTFTNRLSVGSLSTVEEISPVADMEMDAAATCAQLDLVALGLESDTPFSMSPSQGVLQPGEHLEYTLTFAPARLARYCRWAQLLVDKKHPGSGTIKCDTPVLELGMEGIGAPLMYDLTPKYIVLPGSLTPGEEVTRRITMTNYTAAPAEYTFSGMQRWLEVSPAAGTVPPHGNTHLTLRFVAGSTLGKVRGALLCDVLHGRKTPLMVEAQVAAPRLELLTTRLDFGLVRLSGSEVRLLKLRNTSTTCAAEWQLEECGEQRAKRLAAMDGVRASTPIRRQRGQAPSDLTYLEFQPAAGNLSPNQEVQVKVICHGLSDGQHHSTVKLTGPGKAIHCVEAFAAVVTPHAVVSRPKVDLGIAFIGITTRFTVTLKNLALLPLEFSWQAECPPREFQGAEYDDEAPAEMRIRPETGRLLPGEEQEVQVRFTPSVLGPITMFGVCEVQGSPVPAGLVVTCVCRGPDVTYDVLMPEAFKRWAAEVKEPRARRRRDDVDNFQGMTHLPPEILARLGTSRMAQPNPPPDPRHHVANFGAAVPLGEVRSLYVVVTNRTPIPTTLSAWLDEFGAQDSQRLASRGQGSAHESHMTRSGLPSEADAADLVGAGAAHHTSGALSRNTVRAMKHMPIKLNSTVEKLAPFYSLTGNRMMATRRQQQGSAKALGDRGLAVSVSPSEATLNGWGRAVLTLTAYNDMCGDYFDVLHIQVDEVPEKRVPLRIGVSGTPLVVHKERVLRPGLHDHALMWASSLAWGQLPLGVPLRKTFYVLNTGSLDMHLSWTFYRFQDDRDCQRPEARLFTLSISMVDPDEESLDLLDGMHDGGLHVSRAGPSMMWRETDREQLQLVLTPRQGEDADPGMKSSASGLTPLATDGGGMPLAGLGIDEGRVPSAPLVRLALERHAAPDTQPFVIEPAETIIRGGECVRFVVHFVSQHDQDHVGYLLGTQKVLSREGPISLKIWPSGSLGDSVGVMLSGTFHTHAGQPPAPLRPLRVDLSATTVTSRLEPDSYSELSFSCCSTQPPDHAAFIHNVTMSNRHKCPLMFRLAVEGPFAISAACPSAPQDVMMYRGTTGLSTGLPPPGQPLPPAGWEPDVTYLPPSDSIDVTLRFLPQSVEQHAIATAGAAAAGQGAGPSTAQDYTVTGALIVTYDNGDVQRLPLMAHMMHPALELRHAQQLVVPPPLAPGTTAAADGTLAPADAAAPVAGSPVPDRPSTPGETPTAFVGASRSAKASPPIPLRLASGSLTRDLGAPLGFGRVHVQRPKLLEITLLNPTLVDAVWAVTNGDHKPAFHDPSDAAAVAAVAYSEVAMGPFMVRPARGCLAGRGIKLPRTQRVTITFAPPDNGTYRQTLLFAVSKGRPVQLVVEGQGSYDETEEHQTVLFQI